VFGYEEGSAARRLILSRTIKIRRKTRKLSPKVWVEGALLDEIALGFGERNVRVVRNRVGFRIMLCANVWL